MRTVRLTLYFAAPFLFVLLPPSFFDTGHGICIFKNTFGWDCPGCGMTRAIYAMAHGKFSAAVHSNRAVVIVFPLLCYIVAKGILTELRGFCRPETMRIVGRLLGRR